MKGIWISEEFVINSYLRKDSNNQRRLQSAAFVPGAVGRLWVKDLLKLHVGIPVCSLTRVPVFAAKSALEVFQLAV